MTEQSKSALPANSNAIKITIRTTCDEATTNDHNHFTT